MHRCSLIIFGWRFHSCSVDGKGWLVFLKFLGVFVFRRTQSVCAEGNFVVGWNNRIERKAFNAPRLDDGCVLLVFYLDIIGHRQNNND